MNDQHEERDRTTDDAPRAAKRAWHPPTIEQVDYAGTEAAGNPGNVYDGTFYST